MQKFQSTFRQVKYCLIFVEQKNGKYRFFVENDENATNFLLANTKKHEIKDDSIWFAKEALFKKLFEEYDPKQRYTKTSTVEVLNGDYVSALNLLCQKKYKESITTEVIGQVGEDHCPVITVEVKLPNGDYYQASGGNQRIARQIAAKKAYENMLMHL